MKHLKARWYKSYRYGYNLKLQVVEIDRLTHLHREHFKVVDIEKGKELLNPIVVCRVNRKQWFGPRIGNIPFRDRNLAKFEDGEALVISRGNQRVSSAKTMGYSHIDAYVLDDMQETAEIGLRIKEQFLKLCRRYPQKYRDSTPPGRTKQEH